MIVTKNSLVGDVLSEDPKLASFFLEMGMHCLGCSSARGESIEDACSVHGVSHEQLIERINTYLAK